MNTDRMRRALARRAVEAEAVERCRWLEGLPAAHRAIHERHTGPCMICVRDTASRLGQQVGAALSTFGVGKPPRIPPPWPACGTIPPLGAVIPPALVIGSYRRPDGREDVAWMQPHVDYVMRLPLSDEHKQELINRLDQVAVRAFEDAEAEAGHVSTVET